MVKQVTKKMSIIVLGLFFISIFQNLAADESVTISQINTDIKGKSLRTSLLRELQIKEGREFQSLESLTKIVDQRVEQLLRRRLFKEFSLDIISDDPQNIVIDIVVIDSITIIPRPMLKFSSTQGLTMGLKVEYYNAFGTMTDQMTQAYWSPTEVLFEYQIENVPVGQFHLGSNFQQFTGLTRYGDPNGNEVVEYSTTSSTLTFTVETPLGPSSPWSFGFTPVFSYIYNQEVNFNNSVYPDTIFQKYGVSPGFDATIDTDQTRWIGKFRKGFSYDIMSSNLWYTATGAADNFLDTNLAGFLPINSWFAISGRVAGFYALEGIRNDAGDRLRGVLDYMTYGQYGAYLNVQTDFKLFTTPKTGLSMLLGPFADIGYITSQVWDSGPESFEYCAGVTATFYLEAMPSLNFDINCGYDFKRGVVEIIFDTAHFF